MIRRGSRVACGIGRSIAIKTRHRLRGLPRGKGRRTCQATVDMGDIAGFVCRKDEVQWHTSSVADYMNFRC